MEIDWLWLIILFLLGQIAGYLLGLVFQPPTTRR